MRGELEKEWEQRICSIEWKLFAFLSIFFPIESNGEFGLCAFYPIDINAIFYFSSHNWHVHDTSSYVQCSFYYQMSKHCNSNRHNALRYIFFDFCWIAVIRRVKRKKERTWLKQKWYDEKYQSYIKQTHTHTRTYCTCIKKTRSRSKTDWTWTQCTKLTTRICHLQICWTLHFVGMHQIC